MEVYLDYAEKIKFSLIENDENDLIYQIKCDYPEARLNKIIVDNLISISNFSYEDNGNIIKYNIGNYIFVYYNKTTKEITSQNKLTSFEVRSLAQGKSDDIPFKRTKDLDFKPTTDLHTHFAGAFTANSLIEVGLKQNIDYPVVLLQKMGIDISKYKIINDEEERNHSFAQKISLKDICDNEDDLEIFKSNLIIPGNTQETFNKMEEIYSYRGPFTKNKALFKDLLVALAIDYQKNGIEYAELSFSPIIDDSYYLGICEEILPEIEQELGVKISFLGGLWRHSDKEWNMDEVDRLTSLASKSKYIVGSDFMGHETNDTNAFREELENLTEYSILHDPNFVIRVHAGENPLHADNVKQALIAIKEKHDQLEMEQGIKLKFPQVRIGHGLYGVDEDTIALAKELGVIIEFNMSSNLALNNIDDITQIPIKKYLDTGIRVILSTDGHGLYSTNGEQETILATGAGVTLDDFEKIKDTEEFVKEKEEEREKEKSEYDYMPIDEIYNNVIYKTANGLPRYTPAVEEKKRENYDSLLKTLGTRISDSGAVLDELEISKRLHGKIPIMISGASEGSWKNILPEDQKNIMLTAQVLVDWLNADQYYLMTGGTNHGVEREFHRAAHRRNSTSKYPVEVLGTLTEEAGANDNNRIDPDTITCAMVLQLYGKNASKWFELPDAALEMVQQNHGELICFGGGGIVNDIIQRAHNIGLNLSLMDGPEGASTTKSKALQGNDYSFKTPQELLIKLYSKNPNMFMEGFDLSRLDEYVKLASDKIAGLVIKHDADQR